MWEWKKILLTLNRDWNGSMENKRTWKFGNCRIAAQWRHTWKTRTGGSLSGGAVYTGERTWKNARPPLLMMWTKAGTAQQKHPPEIASFHLRNPSFRAFSRWQQIPVDGQPGAAWGWWEWAVSLCHEACTPLPRCAYNLWNSCFVEIMQFFGPWFYERQSFHNPVSMDSKWLQLELMAQGQMKY